jgi:LmbE family N-acetylglucosaminyl deacetylase
VSRTFAAVVAHPDDDTFGVAGTVALHAADPGFRFILVHATSGEAGPIADPSLATRETLGRVREDEDRRSWSALGREPDRHEWLRYPDHGLADVPFDELVGRIAAILADERPDVVTTFGPDGITGHPDHVAVGAATTEAFHRLRREGAGGFRRLIQVAIPQSMLDTWNERLVAAGREPMDPAQMYHPRGVPDETIGLHVDTSSVAARVVEALREHRTQAGDLEDRFSEDDQLEAVSGERGVIAWPPRAPGDPVLRDAFAGLDGSVPD